VFFLSSIKKTRMFKFQVRYLRKNASILVFITSLALLTIAFQIFSSNNTNMLPGRLEMNDVRSSTDNDFGTVNTKPGNQTPLKNGKKYFFVSFRVRESNKLVFSLPQIMYAGYANRVYNILSSLTIALVTNRDCYISCDGLQDYVDYIDLPVVNGYFDYEQGAFESSKPEYSWSKERNSSGLMTTTIDDTPHLIKFSFNVAYFFEVSSNPKYYNKLLEAEMVSMQAIENALGLNNKTEKEKVDALLQVGFEVAGNLLQKVWKLKPTILNSIRGFINEHFNRETFIIGMHIRMDFLRTVPSYLQKFIDCAFEIESKVDYASKRVRWFVISDSIEVVNEIIRKHPDKAFTFAKSKNIPAGIGKVLVDNEVFSYCDELIITPGSTFSFLGALKRQRMPYPIKYNNEKCEKMILSSPPVRIDNDAAIFK
jgi:hypothetical protein